MADEHAAISEESFLAWLDPSHRFPREFYEPGDLLPVRYQAPPHFRLRVIVSVTSADLGSNPCGDPFAAVPPFPVVKALAERIGDSDCWKVIEGRVRARWEPGQ